MSPHPPVNPARAGMIRRRIRGGRRMRRKPRASGDDPVVEARNAQVIEVNPARAGMIRRHGDRRGRVPGKPRASGDDPYARYYSGAADG